MQKNSGNARAIVGQNIAALLQYIESKPRSTILDFGCGPGRDLKVFAELGHTAVGLEGAARFAVMARARSGREVWQQDFLKLGLSDSHFDGVFANAALFHVPSQELPRVLLELSASLKPGGVLFSSNPRGHNEEGWIGGCYGAYHERPDTVVRRCRKGPSAPTGRGEPDVQPVHRA
jgi:SAM-dependent methyltransferase